MRLWRMKIRSPISVITRLIQGKCVQNLLRRSMTGGSCEIKRTKGKLVPGQEQEFWRRDGQGGPRIPAAGRSMRKARCVRRKLLILRPGWQGFMGLGVVDHLGQKLLAERRQS